MHTLKLQVRRISENDCRYGLDGHKWQVIGRVNGWPMHISTRTKGEAQYKKARLLAGLEAHTDYTKLGNAFIDQDGIWNV